MKYQEKIVSILRNAAAELEAIAPEGAGESMILMDEIGYDYQAVLDEDEDFQNSELWRLGRNRFNWLVNLMAFGLNRSTPCQDNQAAQAANAKAQDGPSKAGG